jgi:hypothetical protein
LPPPITTTRRPTGVLQRIGLPHLFDEVDRVHHARQLLAVDRERAHAGQARRDEHRIVPLAQRVERHVAAERDAVCNAMPPTDSSHSTSRCAKSSTVL